MEESISHEAAAEAVGRLPEFHRRRIAAMRDQTTTAGVTLYMPDVLNAHGLAEFIIRVRSRLVGRVWTLTHQIHRRQQRSLVMIARQPSCRIFCDRPTTRLNNRHASLSPHVACQRFVFGSTRWSCKCLTLGQWQPDAINDSACVFLSCLHPRGHVFLPTARPLWIPSRKPDLGFLRAM